MYIHLKISQYLFLLKKTAKNFSTTLYECTDFPKRIHIGCLHMSFLLPKPIKRLVHCAPANIAYFMALSKFKREQVKMSDKQTPTTNHIHQ